MVQFFKIRKSVQGTWSMELEERKESYLIVASKLSV